MAQCVIVFLGCVFSPHLSDITRLFWPLLGLGHFCELGTMIFGFCLILVLTGNGFVYFFAGLVSLFADVSQFFVFTFSQFFGTLSCWG